MKIFRQTIVLVVIFLVVVGFYFLYLKPHGEKKRELEEREKKLVEVNQDDIQEIWISKRDGEKIGFRREGKRRWSIIFPIFADADRFAVGPIASRYSSIEVERAIGEGNLSEYGLDSPRYTVEMKISGGKSFILYIGDRSQVGYSVYVRKEGDNKVFLVSAAVESVIEKSLTDFRERRPMDFIVSDVMVAKISYAGGREVMFKRDEESATDWSVFFPEIGTFVEGDDSKIRDTLYKISGIRVKEFVSDVTEPLEKYGLDSPDMEFDVLTRAREGEEEERYSLIVKFRGDVVFGKRPDRPNVFTLEMDREIRERISAEDYRNKQVLKYYVWRVKEVSIETQAGSKIIRRDEVDTEKWYLVERDQRKPLDASKVKDALRELSDIRVLKFLGDNVDVSSFVREPSARVRIDVEGRAEPYYLVIGGRDKVDGTVGVVAGLMDKRAVYLFPSAITEIIERLRGIQPVQ